jgi:hypothetical protein
MTKGAYESTRRPQHHEGNNSQGTPINFWEESHSPQEFFGGVAAKGRGFMSSTYHFRSQNRKGWNGSTLTGDGLDGDDSCPGNEFLTDHGLCEGVSPCRTQW